MIIGINGYSGSGKDAMGKIIQELQPEKNWQIKKFAGKLKTIASILTGITEKSFEDEKYKRRNLEKAWWTTCNEGDQPMTIREFLQKLGTDGLREGLHPNVWVNALFADYKKIVDFKTYKYATGDIESRDEEIRGISPADLIDYMDNVPDPNWIITDVRFPNEADAIRKKEGVLVRINRFGIKPVNDHKSETSLDGWAFDYIINNDFSLKDLKKDAEEILSDICNPNKLRI